MIELEKIEKIYNAGKATETHALKDINLRIEEGIWLPLRDLRFRKINSLCILLQELIHRVPGISFLWETGF